MSLCINVNNYISVYIRHCRCTYYIMMYHMYNLSLISSSFKLLFSVVLIKTPSECILSIFSGRRLIWSGLTLRHCYIELIRHDNKSINQYLVITTLKRHHSCLQCMINRVNHSLSILMPFPTSLVNITDVATSKTEEIVN